MSKRNEIDAKLARELSGKQKIAALLKARGFTLAGFARKYSRWPEQVKYTLDGTREYPEVRDDLAAELGLSREEIDRLIDEPEPGKADGSDDAARPEAA